MSDRLFVRLEEDLVHGPEADPPAGTLRALLVPPGLRGHVLHILHYRESFPLGHDVVERVVPDGAVRLVFNLGDAPSAGDQPGRRIEAVGPSIAPALVRLSGCLDGISVALRPGAAAALLGMPAAELHDRAVGLDALWGQAAETLWQRLSEAASDGARAEILVSALEHRLRDARPPDGCADHAARLIARSGGTLAVRDVAAAVGLSERRLQQLFQVQVGVSPRAWSRLMRMHACLRRLRHVAAPAWADTAAAVGFYDQAHLVNEFRSLVGLSPTQFVTRAASGSSKTPSEPRAIVA